MDRMKQTTELKRLIYSYALAHFEINIELAIDGELWRFPQVKSE